MSESIEICEIRVIDGVQFVYYNGVKLPMQVQTKIKQGLDQVSSTSNRSRATAIVTLIVNLKDTL